MALIINGEEIPDEVVEQEFSQIKGHHEQMLQVACCERDPEFRGYAKDNVTSRVLLSQAAQAQIPEPSAEEVTEALVKLMAEHGGEEKFYLAMGMPYKDEEVVRENLRHSLRVEGLLKKTYGEEREASEQEMQAFYQSHLVHFLTEEEVRAAHITKTLEGATSRTEAYDRMREIRKELLGGADFETMAGEENDNAEQEIDLGFFKRGEFMEEFETLAFSMQKEEISPVFSTHLGFHLCKVLDLKSAEPKPFDEVREEVALAIREEERDEKLQSLIEELRSEAEIEDRDPDEQEEAANDTP